MNAHTLAGGCGKRSSLGSGVGWHPALDMRCLLLPFAFVACSRTPGSTLPVEHQIACSTSGSRVEGSPRKVGWDDSAESSASPASVFGQVVSTRGAPLPGAQVFLQPGRRPDSTRSRGVTTDSGGYFHFDSVPAGPYILFARRIGWQQQWHQLALMPTRTDSLCIRLREAKLQLMEGPTERP